MTLTIEQVRAKSAAKLVGLIPCVKAAAEALIDRSYALGIPIVVTQGLRTFAEQNALYEQGRTKPGKIVTNARGGYSYHNFGVALDFALLLPDGKSVSWDMDRDYNANNVKDWIEVVDEAKALGLAWGGDWTSFKDYPHFDVTFGLTTAQYRAGKCPTQAQINAILKLIEGDDAMIAEQISALQKTVEEQAAVVQAQAKRIESLEGKAKLGAIPVWATQACVNAKLAGFIDTTADGSYDFYRFVTLLDRAGLFVKEAK